MPQPLGVIAWVGFRWIMVFERSPFPNLPHYRDDVPRGSLRHRESSPAV